MNKIITIQRPLLKVVFLLLFFNLTLFANDAVTNDNVTEVSLSSLSTIGILLMIILSSLLGAFFIKEEV